MTVLHTYLIDVVRPASQIEYETPKVQMVTYAVVAPDPKEAVRRFFDEEGGEIISRGEVVDSIVIGMELQQ